MPEQDSDPPPALAIDFEAKPEGPIGICVQRLGPRLMASIVAHLEAGGTMKAVLGVAVVQTEAPFADGLPNVAGQYQSLETGIRFVPHFPFEPGLGYQATFDPAPLGQCGGSDILTLAFAIPRYGNALPPAVKHVFPSGDLLPENLLRFYLYFSIPMQRGHARDAIVLLGPGGEPASDALYRAPVELWDRTMRVLTILLDPGRLKQGVGPNRALGPPLEPGKFYTLAIGAGMTDLFGRRLDQPVLKRFRVTKAVRQPIAVEQWVVTPPLPGTFQPLLLAFPTALDWAMLPHSISVMSQTGDAIEGRSTTDRCETQWRFKPRTAWAPGRYRVRVDPALEDPCGNNLSGAFDRPLRDGDDPPPGAAVHSIGFEIAALP